jgi:NodT family efflux transporter outer membrane factor (OMF) lipoprotein
MTVQYGTVAESLPMPRSLSRTVLFVGLSALALTACAGLPAESPPAQARGADAYATAQTFSAAPAAWPADRWWEAYGDAELTALIDEALTGSPRLAQAEARVRRAEAIAQQAGARERPSVALNASAQEAKQSYNNGIPAAFVPHGFNDYGRVTLDFSWELDFWGKTRAAVAAAASEARAAQADAAEARLVLATSIAAAYADLARLAAERGVAERAITVQQESERLVAQRVANGLDTRGELRQAQAEPLAARAELSALDEQIALTRNRIAALLGAGPDRGLSIALPKPAALKAFGLPANLSADLLGRRPDLVAARWRAEAGASRVSEARAAFYPNVNLAAFVGLQALHLENLASSGSDIGAVAPALNLPIFDGGRLRAGLSGARADEDAAIASYDAAVAEAFHQVADVVASQKALGAQLADARAALSASEDAHRIARLRYEGELAPYSSVLLAEQAVLRRRRAVADLDARAFALDIALVRALGGGFQSA